jgi:hypothetical protein
MKKMIVVLAAAAALALSAAAPASAGSCRTVKCFNKQVFALQAQVGKLTSALNCLQPVAVSRYPGYDYNGYAGATTALDFTESGDQVSTWVLGIPPGTCGSPQARSAAQSAGKSSDAVAQDSFGPFQAIPRPVEQSNGGR